MVILLLIKINYFSNFCIFLFLFLIQSLNNFLESNSEKNLKLLLNTNPSKPDIDQYSSECTSFLKKLYTEFGSPESFIGNIIFQEYNPGKKEYSLDLTYSCSFCYGHSQNCKPSKAYNVKKYVDLKVPISASKRINFEVQI